MPEIPEIHKFNNDINAWCKGKTFISSHLGEKAKHPAVPFNTPYVFNLLFIFIIFLVYLYL